MKFHFLVLATITKALVDTEGLCRSEECKTEGDKCCPIAGKWVVESGKKLDGLDVTKTASNTLDECKKLCRTVEKTEALCNSFDYNSATSTCQLY